MPNKLGLNPIFLISQYSIVNNKEWNYATRHILNSSVHQGLSKSCLTHSMLPLTSPLWLPEPPSLPLYLNYHGHGYTSILFPKPFHTQIQAFSNYNPLSFCPFSYWICTLSHIFCSHLKHFCSLLRIPGWEVSMML